MNRDMNAIMSFAAAPVIPTGGGEGAGTGGGAGAGGAAGGAGATALAAPPVLNWETAPAQFREGYTKLKEQFDNLNKQYEPWKGLNLQPDQVGHYQQSYQQVYTEVKGIADGLEISEAEVAAAIKAHGLLPVLDQLRYEYQQAEAAASGDQEVIQQQELDERIRATVEGVTRPVLERENQRLVHEGNALTERTITQLAVDAYKGQGLDFNTAPPELRDFVLTGVTEALKYDDDALRGIKFEGKTAGIQRAYQTFTAMWDAAYLARRAMESKLPAPPPVAGKPPVPGQKPQPKLDEMLDNPDLIRTSQGKPAYST